MVPCLDHLKFELRRIFAEDVVNKDEVIRLLESYKSNKADWAQYVSWDDHKYTRNLVDTGNGKYNLMILCWGPGMASSIHDHTDAHCFVKMLDGSLLETKYAWPAGHEAQSQQTVVEDEYNPLTKTEATEYETNGVSYMSDELGLHRMENPSHADGSVSLHLYIPPYDTCNMFDERTGRKTKATVTFTTKYGRKVDYRGSKEGRLCGSPPK